MRAFSATEVLSAVRGQSIGLDDTSLDFTHVEIDSRSVRPGDLFWAIPGERHDGHDFIEKAFARGAACCVAEHDKLPWGSQPAITVDDTRSALGDFAAHHRRTVDALVIGVTGSVGKTTTRHMIHSVLSARHPGVQSPKNFNNDIGVPLSLLAIAPYHEFAVVELAASGSGEIERLAGVAQPEVGVLTAVAPAHLDGFGDLDGVARAKGELLEALPKSGFAVLNGDDDRVRALATRAACPVQFVGERANNGLIAANVQVDNEQLRFRVGNSDFAVPAIGRHHLTSALAALAVAREIGLDDDEIQDGFGAFEPVDGRCRTHRIGGWTVIDDTYNANPASMQAACDLLRDWSTAGQKILVLGDMKSLGADADQHHFELGRTAAGSGADRLLALGDHANQVVHGAREAGMDAGCLGVCQSDQMIELLLDCWLGDGDVVLVKGSRALRMERFVHALQQRAVSVPSPQRAA